MVCVIIFCGYFIICRCFCIIWWCFFIMRWCSIYMTLLYPPGGPVIWWWGRPLACFTPTIKFPSRGKKFSETSKLPISYEYKNKPYEQSNKPFKFKMCVFTWSYFLRKKLQGTVFSFFEFQKNVIQYLKKTSSKCIYCKHLFL